MTTVELLGGFGALAAAAVALEVRARAGRGRIPTFGDLVGTVMRRRSARLAVLAGWMWLGWHLFVR